MQELCYQFGIELSMQTVTTPNGEMHMHRAIVRAVSTPMAHKK